MTRETLWNLRMEICLYSLYYTDFRNSFGIDEHAVCDFFDGYVMSCYRPNRGHNR